MSDDHTLSVPPSLKRFAVRAGMMLKALIYVAEAGILVGAVTYAVLKHGFGYAPQTALLIGTLLGMFIAGLIPVLKLGLVVLTVAARFWVHASETFDTRQHRGTHRCVFGQTAQSVPLTVVCSVISPRSTCLIWLTVSVSQRSDELVRASTPQRAG